MAAEFLKEIASARLPKVTYRPKEIRSIKALSDAGMVIALFSNRDGYGEIPYAQVVALTEQGHRELLDCRVTPLAPRSAPATDASATGIR